jgi:DNA-binding LacI/PurR family transcriptional regulator
MRADHRSSASPGLHATAAPRLDATLDATGGAALTDRATLTTVAELAGTSRQTVSNVLNAPHLVKPETAHRVRRAIETLDYRPSRAARELRTRRSRLLAARVEPGDAEFGGGVIDTFLHAMTIAADAKGYRVVLYTAADNDSEIGAFDEMLATLNVDAFVLTSARPDDTRAAHLLRRRVPFVTFGRPWDDLDSHPWVDVDGAAGTAAAVDHLVERGHRRIGFLGWWDDHVGRNRLVGWREAMNRHGLSTKAVGASPHSFEAARSATTALCDTHQPTAIVCASDVVAFGAMDALGQRRSIATHGDGDGDVAIVGFDDTPAARAVGLSSLAQPLEQVAEHCMAVLAAALDGTPPVSRQLVLPPRLKIRATSSVGRSTPAS